MGKKTAIGWRWRALAALALVAALAAGWLWWQAQHWTPSRAQFPTQGVLIGAQDGPVDIDALAAVGTDFVYLEASEGGEGRDAMLADNLDHLRGSTMPFGTLHVFDPCVPAERQAANFVTIVPRGAGMLPPAIALDKLASDCEDPLAETALEGELTVFLNQVESHAGQPAILKLSRGFEEAYGIAGKIDRNLWLDRTYFEPDYAGRPWTLWTANPALRSEAAAKPLRWVVAQQ
jgi:lysozyme